MAFIRYVLFYSFCSKRPHKDTGNRPGSAQQSYYELDLQRERSTDTMAQKTTFVSNQKLILNKLFAFPGIKPEAANATEMR